MLPGKSIPFSLPCFCWSNHCGSEEEIFECLFDECWNACSSVGTTVVLMENITLIREWMWVRSLTRQTDHPIAGFCSGLDVESISVWLLNECEFVRTRSSSNRWRHGRICSRMKCEFVHTRSSSNRWRHGRILFSNECEFVHTRSSSNRWCG